MKEIQINEETAKTFLKNLQDKKYMICYVYYHSRLSQIFIDIAQTKYGDDDIFYICCRGTTYLDHISFEGCSEEQKISLIINTVYSFIEGDPK